METPLEALLRDPTHIRGYGLVVKLNGTSLKLLLDTGSGGILVDRKTAERAGIKGVAQPSVVTSKAATRFESDRRRENCSQSV